MENFILKCKKINNNNNKSSNKIKTDTNILIGGTQPNKNMRKNCVVLSNMAKEQI